MATELMMPALSPTMEKGTLAKWLVKEGDRISPGDSLAEIESDKATMELEAAEGGLVARLLVAAGTDDVAVGTPIALLIDGDRQDMPREVPAASATAAAPAPQRPAGRAATSPAPSPLADMIAPASAPDTNASPLAQRLAAARNISLVRVAGTGLSGRIVRADLGLAPRAQFGELAPGSEDARSSAPAGQASSAVAPFYVSLRCMVEPLSTLRDELNEALASRRIVLSAADLLIKATALALVRVPAAHVRLDGGARDKVGIAVIVDGQAGQVLRDVAALSLSTITAIRTARVEKVGERRLSLGDVSGPAISFTDLSGFGVDMLFPALEPAYTLALGVADAVLRRANTGSERETSTVMTVTAAFDARTIDSATAAAFMTALRELVETPLLLLG